MLHWFILIFCSLVCSFATIVLLTNSRYTRRLDFIAGFVAVLACLEGAYFGTVNSVYVALSLAYLSFLLRHYERSKQIEIKLNRIDATVPIFQYKKIVEAPLKEWVNLGELKTKRVSDTEKYCVFITKLEPKKKYPSYCSDFEKQFVILEGGITIHINGTQKHLNIGDKITIDKYEKHDYNTTEEGCVLKVICINPKPNLKT